MKYSYLLIPGLLLAFNAHASDSSEEFKDKTKSSWSQLPLIHSSQMVNSETEYNIDSPRNQKKAEIMERSAKVQAAERTNNYLEKRVKELEEEEKIKLQHKQKEQDELQQSCDALKQQEMIQKQRFKELQKRLREAEDRVASQKPEDLEPTSEQILAIIASDKSGKSSHQQASSKEEIVRGQQRILDEFAAQKANNSNNQNVPNANSAIIVSSAKSQYDPGYESSAEFSDFEEDLSYKPADPRFTATVIEDDNNQNVQPIAQAPVVTSIENDNVPIANNVNNQPGQTESNSDRSRNNNFTAENVLRGIMGDEYKPRKSNWVNLTSFFRNG